MAKYTVWTKGMSSEQTVDAEKMQVTDAWAIFYDSQNTIVMAIPREELILAQREAAK